MLKHNKQYYRDLSYNNHIWSGFWDGLHHFIEGNNRTGFYDCAVSESDLDDGSYKFIIDNGLTRIN